MHQTKIDLQSTCNQSELGRICPDWIKIDEHCRHIAIVVVSAMKILKQKQNRKTVY